MAATFVTFSPPAPFTFQASMGGALYTVTVSWNVFGQRYYVSVSDLSGNLLICRAVTSSGPQLQAAFAWADSVATAATQSPHNVPVGSVVNAYVSQTQSGFDGFYSMLATSGNVLTYVLATNPNEAIPINGTVSFNLNLVATVIPGGYLFYREATQQYEFGP